VKISSICLSAISGIKSTTKFFGVKLLSYKGEQTVVLATDCGGQALQLYRDVIADGAIASQDAWIVVIMGKIEYELKY